MDALLQDPETTGVSVEILPDLFVTADVARRVQVLVLGLMASLCALAADRGLVDGRALVRALSGGAPQRARASEDRPDPRRAEYAKAFRAAGTRGLELLRYAVATAPADVKIASIELAADAEAPFDPARTRVRVTCDASSKPAVDAYLESLKVVLPSAAVHIAQGDDGARELVIEGEAGAEAGR